YECQALRRLPEFQLENDDTSALRVLVRILAYHAMESQQVTPGASAETSSAASAPLAMRYKDSSFAHVEALEHHLDAVGKDAKHAVKQVARAVAKLFPTGSLQLSTSAIVKLFFAIQSNAHAMVDDRSSSIRGLGLFPLASMLNHSCIPNVALCFSFGTEHNVPVLTFRALRNISAGEELCYSYVDLYQTTAQRRHMLQAAYHFTCGCVRCTATDALHAALQQGSTMASMEDKAAKATAEHDAPIGGARCLNDNGQCCGAVEVYCGGDDELHGVCLSCSAQICDGAQLYSKAVLATTRLEAATAVAMNAVSAVDIARAGAHNELARHLTQLKEEVNAAGSVLHGQHQAMFRAHRTMADMCKLCADSAQAHPSCCSDHELVALVQDGLASLVQVAECCDERPATSISRTAAELCLELSKGIARWLQLAPSKGTRDDVLDAALDRAHVTHAHVGGAAAGAVEDHQPLSPVVRGCLNRAVEVRQVLVAHTIPVAVLLTAWGECAGYTRQLVVVKPPAP
ncbi:hypothetical protein JKP88DRAFT_249267, partial [Tribonema minus]